MSEELSNENLLLGCLWEIREACKRNSVELFYIEDAIDSCCKSLTPPVDLDTWDNDFPKGGAK